MRSLYTFANGAPIDTPLSLTTSSELLVDPVPLAVIDKVFEHITNAYTIVSSKRSVLDKLLQSQGVSLEDVPMLTAVSPSIFEGELHPRGLTKDRSMIGFDPIVAHLKGDISTSEMLFTNNDHVISILKDYPLKNNTQAVREYLYALSAALQEGTIKYDITKVIPGMIPVYHHLVSKFMAIGGHVDPVDVLKAMSSSEVLSSINTMGCRVQDSLEMFSSSATKMNIKLLHLSLVNDIKPLIQLHTHLCNLKSLITI